MVLYRSTHWIKLIRQNMLKISKLADYATIIMCLLAEKGRDCCSSAQIASQTPVPPATVSKILKLLNEAGLVNSARGVNGGYRLARLPNTISVADIVTAIDGKPAMTECSQLASQCQHDSVCQLRSHWQLINGAVYDVLNSFSLVDLVGPLATIKLPQKKLAVCQSLCQGKIRERHVQ